MIEFLNERRLTEHSSSSAMKITDSPSHDTMIDAWSRDLPLLCKTLLPRRRASVAQREETEHQKRNIRKYDPVADPVSSPRGSLSFFSATTRCPTCAAAPTRVDCSPSGRDTRIRACVAGFCQRIVIIIIIIIIIIIMIIMMVGTNPFASGLTTCRSVLLPSQMDRKAPGRFRIETLSTLRYIEIAATARHSMIKGRRARHCGPLCELIPHRREARSPRRTRGCLVIFVVHRARSLASENASARARAWEICKRTTRTLKSHRLAWRFLCVFELLSSRFFAQRRKVFNVKQVGETDQQLAPGSIEKAKALTPSRASYFWRM